MLASLSSNIIYAKVRARYGKRLTPQNYKDLLACRDVSDIANYLITNTAYAQALGDLKNSEVHRGYLERLLRKNLFDDYFSLCRYNVASGDHVAEYIITQGEIQQLLHFILNLTSRNPEKFYFNIPDFLNTHSPVDLYALSKARSYPEFLACLEDTPYKEIFLRHPPDENGNYAYADIERDLFIYSYGQFLGNNRKMKEEDKRDGLQSLFLMQIELQNIVKIYRAKKYYHFDSARIEKLVLPYRCLLKKSQLAEMIEAGTAEEVLGVLQKTKYSSERLGDQFTSIDSFADHLLYEKAHKNICFSSNASLVLVSYIVLKSIELDNIINIIEGRRYGMSAEEIEKLLIGRWS